MTLILKRADRLLLMAVEIALQLVSHAEQFQVVLGLGLGAGFVGHLLLLLDKLLVVDPLALHDDPVR